MWKVARPLGRGSFGFVSLAIISQPNDESKINLPSLMAVKSADVFQQYTLQIESELQTKLHSCPHILRCFGGFVSEEEGVFLYNILLEYASSGSLADRIRSSGSSGGGGGLGDYEVRWHTKCLLKGLSHIHKQGYVHCDIKPHNLLLVGRSPSDPQTRRARLTRETLKIADFGQAKKVGEDGKSTVAWRGTPLYMAPESVLAKEYEPWSDIWALGCTVLEMITGKPAWKCDSETETCAILYRIGFSGKVPEIPGWVSEEGKDFLSKCLVRETKSRWSADMLLEHPFVSSNVMVRESRREELSFLQVKHGK